MQLILLTQEALSQGMVVGSSVAKCGICNAQSKGQVWISFVTPTLILGPI
jgi:hypothetical protein